MGIDANDLKILINAGFRYLMKTCHQWAKDHPLVSGVLLFFYLLYIFFPYLFSILFYTFPLIICTAILLGAPHIKSRENQEQIKNNNKKYDIIQNASFNDRRRAQLTSQLSRRTLGRNKNIVTKTENIGDFPPYDNVPRNETCATKQIGEDTNSSAENVASEHTSRHTSTGILSHSDTESQEDEDEEESHEAKNKVLVEWTEDDQRNLVDLGTSEIERNKRLESLIAKRRARKLLSMQPRRTHYPYENLMDQVGSIMVSRCFDIDNAEQQPGSAPCVLRPIRNSFDLPYDPHEEKPILTGGSFGEEFFSNEDKEKLALPVEGVANNKHDGLMGELNKEDPVGKSFPSFFTKPKSVEKPGFTRFRRESEESMKEIVDQLAKEAAQADARNNQQESSKKVQLSQSCSDEDDHKGTNLTLRNEEEHGLENPFARDFDPSYLEKKYGEELETNNDNKNSEENIFHMDSEVETRTKDEVQPTTQDHVSGNKDHDEGEISSSSSSTSSSSTVISINASKNEAFRNSVRKVLNCLVLQRNKEHAIKENTSNDDVLFGGIPNVNTPTKMEERSFYTNRPHHTTTFSIASDMQVEVSDTGSPPLATLDPSSPTDRESLVYDGDVDKDANSGDEDLWGASPHPMKLGEFAPKFKLADINEEGNNNVNLSEFGRVLHDTTDRNIMVGEHSLPDEVEQRPGERTSSSLSPTSILPRVDHDQNSIDGDIVESRSSVSSISDGLTSQMQAKSEHLAVYLANLPPGGSGPNVLEEPESSDAREPSVDEGTIEVDMHPESEMYEDKDELREIREEVGDSHQVSHTHETSPHQEMYIVGDLDNQPKITEDEQPTFVEHDNAMETSSVSKPMSREKEVIPDSFSTTCQEEILDQSRLEEGHNNFNLEEEEDMKIIPTNEGDDFNKTKSVLDETNMEIEEKFQRAEDVPQPATIEEDNMEPSSTVEVVSSNLVENPEANSDHPKT